MKLIKIFLLITILFSSCSSDSKETYTTNSSATGQEVVFYTKSFSYVKDAVIADNGGLIVSVDPLEKNPQMLANSFLNSAKAKGAKLKYCKIVSSVGAKRNGNYINGKQLALVSAKK